VIERSGGPWLAGGDVSHADLSLFQTLEGLAYAFPHSFARASPEDGARARAARAGARAAAHRRVADRTFPAAGLPVGT